jgi:PadR family transcriptional regulator, regulatory protein PadR
MKGKTASREGTIGLLQGTLDMMILRTLERGPQHGHGIGLAIRTGSDEFLHIERGSLYPALHRLEEQGWIDAQWKMSEHNQRAKYYRLTPAGRKQLAIETSRWERMVQAIAGVMRPA